MSKSVMIAKPTVTEVKKKRNVFQIIGEMIPGLKKKSSGWGAQGIETNVYNLNWDKTDYELAQDLYYNTAGDYVLGAGLLKPIIDTTAGFLGAPKWMAEDESARGVLEAFAKNNKKQLSRINRNVLRDGDCYVRIVRRNDEDDVLFPGKTPKVTLEILPVSGVDVTIDPRTGKPNGFRVTTSIEFIDASTVTKKYQIVETVSASTISRYYDGPDIPMEYSMYTKDAPETEPNKWGFVNIIHFKNDEEASDLYGRSEMEPAVPLIKAYHDVMYNSMINNKLHSAPKLIMNVKDVASFLMINFGVDIENSPTGASTSINLQGQEILITNNDDDKIELAQAKPTMSDSSALLKFLFMCIVDVTQTPEFVFGNAVNSSKASVKEQMTPMIKKVARKRDMLEENYQLMARMVLAITDKVEAVSSSMEYSKISSYETAIIWPPVVERDVMTESTALVQLVNAFQVGIEGKFISLQSAMEYIGLVVTQMSPYGPVEDKTTEMARVLEGINILRDIPDPYIEEIDEGSEGDEEDIETPARKKPIEALTVAEARTKERDRRRNTTSGIRATNKKRRKSGYRAMRGHNM